MIKELKFLDPEVNYNGGERDGPWGVDQLNEWLKDNPTSVIMSLQHFPSRRVSKDSEVLTKSYIVAFVRVGE